MALWGNDDNLVSSGIVTVNYSNLTITGSGTTFGQTGFGVTGDVIRLGTRGAGGVYYGEAVIVDTGKIAADDSQTITIGSTSGLSGDAIAGAAYYLSQLPKQTTTDHTWSGKHRTPATYKKHLAIPAEDASAVGELNISANLLMIGRPNDLKDISAGDQYLDSPGAATGTAINVIGVGTANATTTSLSPVGYGTIFLVAPPGVVAGNSINVTVGGVAGATVTSVASTYVNFSGAGAATTISTAVAKDVRVMFTSDDVISLASTISSGISTGDTLYFQRKSGGYDKLIYGISDTTSALYDGDSGNYRTEGGGWVGVTTYIDMHGNLRVKSETMVAMSGISTGIHGIGYPTAEN